MSNRVRLAAVLAVCFQMSAQNAQDANAKLMIDAEARIKAGQVQVRDLNLISKTKSYQLIPDLEKAFGKATDDDDRLVLAHTLVKLGGSGPTYWSYLTQRASNVLDLNEPRVKDYEQDGKPKAGLSPTFLSWAEAHHIPPEIAAQDALFRHAAVFMVLGGAGDKRAIPLLKRGLNSQNEFVQAAAAGALADLQDSASVPLIIQATRSAPPGASVLIAQSLLSFNDVDAQKTVSSLIPEERLRTLRQIELQRKSEK